MVQNGEIAEMRASLKGSGVSDTNSSGSVASSRVLPQMDAVTTEVDALPCEDDDVAMPLVESTIMDKAMAISEDEEGMQGDRAMSFGVSIVEI